MAEKSEGFRIPPEEEAVFKEFQEYVRSVYEASTSQSVQKLNQATRELHDQILALHRTVVESRDNYQNLFDPAVVSFQSKTKQTIDELASQLKNLFLQHEKAIHGILSEQHQASSDLLKFMLQEHRTESQRSLSTLNTNLTQQMTRMEDDLMGHHSRLIQALTKRVGKYFWILVAVIVVLNVGLGVAVWSVGQIIAK